jgi:hypothetical protein
MSKKYGSAVLGGYDTYLVPDEDKIRWYENKNYT